MRYFAYCRKSSEGEERQALSISAQIDEISRAESAPDDGRPFFVYLDEFHNFTTLMLANMMSELRKYAVGMVLGHQYMHQLEPDIRHAVLGNAGTIISFRVGAEDAIILADEFQPVFDTLDLHSLPNRLIYLKLMIDGVPSRPFSGTTLAIEHPDAQIGAPDGYRTSD